MVGNPTAEQLNGVKQNNVQWDANAYRVYEVDSSGDEKKFITLGTDLEGKGDITVGTSEVELSFSGTTKCIRIKADSTNTGTIFIGKTGILNDGSNDFARLSANEELIIDYDDTDNPICVISDVAGQKINVGAIL